jgi:iron complex transport system substrate-binding protein
MFCSALFRFAFLTFFMLLSLWACNGDSKNVDVRNVPKSLIAAETSATVSCRLPDGSLSVLPKHPKRTVVLLTSLLDLWDQTGGEVVGRCVGDLRVPARARKAEVVGSFNNPNVEKIIALEPDLVISSDVGNFRAMIPILEQNDIAYAYFNYVNYHDYRHILDLFARINGTQGQVKTDLENMATEVNGIIQGCAGRTPPRVLVIFTTSNSISCELPGSQAGVMLSLLGAENVIADRYRLRDKTRVDFSLEKIVQLDPDIILLNTMGDVAECRDRLRKEYETNAAWSTLQAIRNGRFHVLPKEYFLYKPNDEFPEALRYLAALLYRGK